MRTRFMLLFLSILTGTTGWAGDFTCPAEDLSFSLARKEILRQQEKAVLTISCKGHSPISIETSADGYRAQMNGNGSSVTSYEMRILVDQVANGTQIEHQESLMRNYLSILIMAKTQKLPVKITYNEENKKDLTVSIE